MSECGKKVEKILQQQQDRVRENECCEARSLTSETVKGFITKQGQQHKQHTFMCV